MLFVTLSVELTEFSAVEMFEVMFLLMSSTSDITGSFEQTCCSVITYIRQMKIVEYNRNEKAVFLLPHATFHLPCPRSKIMRFCILLYRFSSLKVLIVLSVHVSSNIFLAALQKLFSPQPVPNAGFVH